MQTVESRTTTERIVRSALLAGMLVAFATAFLWDGFVGYPRENAQAFAVSLGIMPDRQLRIDSTLTGPIARKIVDQIGNAAPLDHLIERLGEPTFRTDTEAYYIGTGGYLRLVIDGQTVRAGKWKSGPHGEADIRWQRWIGYVLALAGVMAIGHFLGVVTARVSVTDRGLKVRRTSLIQFEAITAITSGGGAKQDPDSVAVEYKASGRARVLRLDAYMVKDLAKVEAALRERAGFPITDETGRQRAEGKNSPGEPEGPA